MCLTRLVKVNGETPSWSGGRFTYQAEDLAGGMGVRILEGLEAVGSSIKERTLSRTLDGEWSSPTEPLVVSSALPRVPRHRNRYAFFRSALETLVSHRGWPPRTERR